MDLPQNIKPGDVYINIHTNNEFVVSEIKGTSVMYYAKDYPSLFGGWWLGSFLDHFEYKGSKIEKPLDKVMKQLDKQFCLHKNVKRDIYFTAKVFLTCKDCGKALN